MFRVPITKGLLGVAKAMSQNIPNLNNSIREGKGNTIGTLGELGVIKYLRAVGMSAHTINDYEYDIMTEETNLRVEVKSKQCSSPPLSHYDCSVANFNKNQKCDLYYFVRVTDTDIYVLGCLTPKDFYKRATFHKKGTTDTNMLASGMKFKFRADCYNVPISRLIPTQKTEELKHNTKR